MRCRQIRCRRPGPHRVTLLAASGSLVTNPARSQKAVDRPTPIAVNPNSAGRSSTPPTLAVVTANAVMAAGMMACCEARQSHTGTGLDAPRPKSTKPPRAAARGTRRRPSGTGPATMARRRRWEAEVGRPSRTRCRPDRIASVTGARHADGDRCRHRRHAKSSQHHGERPFIDGKALSYERYQGCPTRDAKACDQ